MVWIPSHVFVFSDHIDVENKLQNELPKINSIGMISNRFFGVSAPYMESIHGVRFPTLILPTLLVFRPKADDAFYGYPGAHLSVERDCKMVKYFLKL